MLRIIYLLNKKNQQKSYNVLLKKKTPGLSMEEYLFKTGIKSVQINKKTC